MVRIWRVIESLYKLYYIYFLIYFMRRKKDFKEEQNEEKKLCYSEILLPAQVVFTLCFQCISRTSSVKYPVSNAACNPVANMMRAES